MTQKLINLVKDWEKYWKMFDDWHVYGDECSYFKGQLILWLAQEHKHHWPQDLVTQESHRPTLSQFSSFVFLLGEVNIFFLFSWGFWSKSHNAILFNPYLHMIHPRIPHTLSPVWSFDEYLAQYQKPYSLFSKSLDLKTSKCC